MENDIRPTDCDYAESTVFLTYEEDRGGLSKIDCHNLEKIPGEKVTYNCGSEINDKRRCIQGERRIVDSGDLLRFL